jgi:hypothetical protein
MVSQSNSSDYYEEEDSQFLEALSKAVLPGDVLPEDKLDEAKHEGDISSEELEPPPPTQPSLKRRWSDVQQHDLSYDATNQLSKESMLEEDDTYSSSRFGGFGDYMRRKRAKLQIQNADIVEGLKDGPKSQIFKGLSVYVSHPFVYICSISSQSSLDKWVDETFGARFTSTYCPQRRNLSTISRQEGACVRFYLCRRVPPSRYANLSSQDPHTYLLVDTSQSTRVQTYEGRSTRMARR